MDAQGMLDGKQLQRLGEDSISLFEGEGLEGFVFEPRDFLPLVMVPYPAFETDVAAGAAVEQFAARGDGIDGRFGEAKPHQPPATGGMKTTASPALKRRDQSANSLLTATFNCSRDNVKP